jgi:hypothetical protein
MAGQRTIITLFSDGTVKQIDKYAKSLAPKESRPNRSGAIRVLVDRGLEAVTRGERGSAGPATRRRA